MIYLAVTSAGLARLLASAHAEDTIWCGEDAISEADYRSLARPRLNRFIYALGDRSLLRDAVDTIEEHHPGEFLWIEAASDARPRVAREDQPVPDQLTPPIQRFVQHARGYCGWCEAESLGDHPESQAAGWLARLYAAALLLPPRSSDNEDGLPDLPEPEAGRARRNLASFAGLYYREVFDPDPDLAEEPVTGDVGDDLLDVYLDIKAGLVLFDRGALDDAMWHWSLLHRVHWGRHAVGGMLALHCLHVAKQDD